MPGKGSIPALKGSTGPHSGIGFSAINFDIPNEFDAEYYQKLANYEFVRRLFRPIRLVVKNAGEIAAGNVRAELTVPSGARAMVASSSALPRIPTRRLDLLAHTTFGDGRRALGHSPGDVTINRNEERFRIEIDCGNLQPGRRIWSDAFSIGARTAGDVFLVGQV